MIYVSQDPDKTEMVVAITHSRVGEPLLHVCARSPCECQSTGSLLEESGLQSTGDIDMYQEVWAIISILASHGGVLTINLITSVVHKT